MEIISPEILKEIFYHLNELQRARIKRVCYLWGFLIKSFGCDFNKIFNLLTLKNFSELPLNTYHPNYIKFDKYNELGSEYDYMEYNEMVYLSFSNISKEIISKITTKCNNLKWLTIGCGYQRYLRFDEILYHLDLKNNFTLISLHIIHCFLNNDNIDKIIKALITNKTLTTLIIYSSFTTINTMVKLEKMIKINKSITYLDMGYNGIGDEGAMKLAEALKINKSLTYLNIEKNNISNEGVMKLVDSLKINKSLTHLDIRYNMINYETLKFITENYSSILKL